MSLQRKASKFLNKDKNRYKNATKKGDLLPYVLKSIEISPFRYGFKNDNEKEAYFKEMRFVSSIINRITVAPNEIFDFWKALTRIKSDHLIKSLYDVQIKYKRMDGFCELATLINYLALHAPLTISERQSFNVDFIEDKDREFPFGVETLVIYDAINYQFVNDTDLSFQLCIFVCDEKIYGEIRSSKKLDYAYELESVNDKKTQRDGSLYHENQLLRRKIDIEGSKIIAEEIISDNSAKIAY